MEQPTMDLKRSGRCFAFANPSVASQRPPNARARSAARLSRFAMRRSCASMTSRSTGSYLASHAESPPDAPGLAAAAATLAVT